MPKSGNYRRRGHARTLSDRLGLVVITDAELALPRALVDVVGDALRAGARTIQLRDKRSSGAELCATARDLREVTHEADALLFINDRLDVALAVGADGVHLGPDDIPVDAVRASVPRSFLIGASTDDPERARTLAAAGADYIGCGTVYETRSKTDAGRVIGLDGLERVATAVAIPVIGIGGVSAERSAEIAATSASGIAVIRAVMAAEDVGAAVSRLMAPWVGRVET